MKKIFLSLAMIAFVSAGAFAQGVSGGLKAGVNLANWSGDDVEDSEMKISFHGGGFLNIAFSDALSVQPELLFNSVGTKFTEGDYSETYKLSYISIPVMLMYSFGNFNIQAGPQFSILAGAKVKYEEGGDSLEEDIKDSLKGSDIGVNVGLGASFGKVNATARYCLGLSNIVDDDDADIKNGVIQLSLGVKLFGN